MFNMPILGCVTEKYAGAYLIPPVEQEKKKKKRKPQSPGIDKLATAAAIQALDVQQAIMQRRIQSGNLGGGWNPSNQLVDNNS
jgi:hypothetical protein